VGAHKTRRDRAEQYAIWALVLAFVVLAGVYSVVTPLYEASDELWHYPFVKNLADGRGLPVQDPTNPGPWAQEGSQPPLYYALAALISRSVAEDDPARVLRPNPHANIGAVMPDGNANMALHTAVESFPYRGTVLAIHLVRAYSVLLGAVTVLFTYAIGMELLPDRPALALAAAGVVAFTPMFLFISGSVNNDNLVVALATVALWQMLRLVRLGPTAPRWALLGATIGLAALTKLSGLALVAPAGLALVWLTWRRRQQWRMALWGGLCIVGGVALLAGWWYYRNWRLYGDPLGLNVFLTIAGRRAVRPSLVELLGEWSSLVKSYWGVFGGMNVVPPEWFYGLLNGLAILALLGLALEAGRRLVHRRWPDPEALFRFGLVALWPVIVMASLVRWTMMTMASQGRLIFPAIASISYLLVLGLGAWAPRRRALPGLVAMAIMAVLAGWTPFGVIAPAYAPPRLLTEAEVAAIPERLDLQVGEGMELLGYRLDATEVRPGDDLAVTLYWRARARMDRDYSVFVHLLDQNGIKIAQRDRYPGRGLFPTTLWRPGDAIADTYFVHVPENTFNPNRLTLEVGLYVLRGERLPIRDREGRAVGDAVRLPEVRLHAEARDGIANPLAVNLSGKARLVGYDLARTALPAGETLDLTLFWKPLEALASGHRAFAVLRAWDGAVWVGAAGRSVTEAGRAWQPGQVITDTLSLVLPPDMPPGEYYVDAGMYAGAASQRLSVVGRGGRLEGDRYALTRIRVLPATRPGESGSPSPQHALDVTFPGVARLVGYSIDQQVVNPYERLRLTLYWEAVNEDALSTDYTVFTHLLDAGSRVVAQHDGPPASGWRPTSSWTRAEVIVDPHHLAFSDLSFAGEGVVEVGLYDPATMQRLLTATGEDRVVLPVRVVVKP
jgi:4-amino-4-deoxy-L-arabinose transferase-like glycosyltransferase